MPVCCDCKRDLVRRDFAKSQLKKLPDKRRCTECVDGEETCSLAYLDRIAAARRAEFEASRPALRFRVGDRVDCSHSSDASGRCSGTIIQLWYREDSWDHVPADFHCPYQIQLDSGHVICAPKDIDGYIRTTDVPPPNCSICLCNDQTEENFIVRDCACRGTQGYIHLECLKDVAISRAKAEIDSGRADTSGFNPFIHCVTCRLTFSRGSPSAMVLARACYETFSDEDETPWWHSFAAKNLVRNMVERGDDDGAKILLEKRVSMIRLRIKALRKQGYLTYIPAHEIELSELLLESVDVYEKKGMLSEMKPTLDEICRLKEKYEFDGPRQIRINQRLSSHSKLLGDIDSALKYAKEVLREAREECASVDSVMTDQYVLSDALSECGRLCVKLLKYSEGIPLMEESLAIDEKVAGKQSKVVHARKKMLEMAKLESRTSQTEASAYITEKYYGM